MDRRFCREGLRDDADVVPEIPQQQQPYSLHGATAHARMQIGQMQNPESAKSPRNFSAPDPVREQPHLSGPNTSSRYGRNLAPSQTPALHGPARFRALMWMHPAQSFRQSSIDLVLVHGFDRPLDARSHACRSRDCRAGKARSAPGSSPSAMAAVFPDLRRTRKVRSRATPASTTKQANLFPRLKSAPDGIVFASGVSAIRILTSARKLSPNLVHCSRGETMSVTTQARCSSPPNAETLVNAAGLTRRTRPFRDWTLHCSRRSSTEPSGPTLHEAIPSSRDVPHAPHRRCHELGRTRESARGPP